MPSQRDRQKQPSSSFRLLIEYDGTRYSGWQRQAPPRPKGGGPREAGAAPQGSKELGAEPKEPVVKTIAGAIGHVMHHAGLQIRNFKGAGRTDAGVHALGQVAHVHLEEPMMASDLQYILERGLPYDIAVPSVEPCQAGFDARHDAVSRTYLYRVTLRKSAFSKHSTWWPKLPLDLRLIEDTWPLFEGNRSMAAFADLEEGEDANCQIYSCQTDRDGHLLLLRVTARFFLKRQVRRMVGAVVNCAMDRADVARLREDLAKPGPESAMHWAELAAPASGLFLERVDYRGDRGDARRNS